jgi:hypothetical protein
MNYQLKSISKAGIGEALKKAERYRLLNEPRLAESICSDILALEPDNHAAIVTMLLSVTDQFGSSSASAGRARKLLPLLTSDYERTYYSGIICERQGISVLNQMTTGTQFTAYELLVEAMECYEKAEAIRPAGNDDAILRWNTCARLIMSHNLHAREESRVELPLE